MIVEQPKLETPAQQIAQLMQLGFAVDEKVDGYSLEETLIRFQRANGLDDDGEYGPLTQAALFGYMGSTESYLSIVIRVASAMVGISEVPEGSNKGPQIDIILKSVGLGPGYAWCAAFMYWCHKEAARQLNTKNRCPKSAGVLNMWDLAGYRESGLKRITPNQAKTNPSLIKPGMQLMLQFGPRTGHTGIVEAVQGDKIITIEGNTNTGLSREGVGVFRLTKRSIASINLGFVDYSG